MDLKLRILIGLLLVCFKYSAVKLTDEFHCDKHVNKLITGDDSLPEIFENHSGLLEAYLLRDKSTLTCFEFIIQLMNYKKWTNNENASLPVYKQEKRQLPKKPNRRRPKNKYQATN